ncbi:MAG: bifunctional UDP-sugar hydrolase/5'-nucleotidase [Bacteriovoracia bacterium]
MPKKAIVFTTRVGILLTLLIFTRCAHGPATQALPDPAKYDQIVVVGTNDFHGYLRPFESTYAGQSVVSGGAEWFAGHVRILEKKYGDQLVLLDAGDIFQGTMESNTFKGASTLAYYNLLPYRASAVGNHEFDYGALTKGSRDRLGALKARMAEAKFPFLQANIFIKGTNKLWREKNLQPSVIVKAGGHKVGIIGLTTITTPAKTLPTNVANLDFRALEPVALAEAQKLRKQGADLVIITTHEGGEQPGDPIYELLHALPKGTIDAVVSGHAHSEIHQFVNGVPVIQSKTRGVFFGRIDLFVDKASGKVEPSLTKIYDMHPICGIWFAQMDACDAKMAKNLVDAGKAREADFVPFRRVAYENEEVSPDLTVRATLAPYFEKINVLRKEVLAESAKDFERYPSGETQMGFLFLHAYRWKFPQAKVVYLNGGGIRRAFLKGPMTYGDLFEVHPFENYATLVKISGKQLRALLEVAVSGAQGIPAISGIKATYHNEDRPEYLRDLNRDGKKETWERNRLVSLTWDDGTPVKDSDDFWLATIDFLVNGGDNADVAFGALPPERKKFTDQQSRDVVAEYLRAHKGIALPTRDEMRIRALP